MDPILVDMPLVTRAVHYKRNKKDDQCLLDPLLFADDKTDVLVT